MHLPTKHGRRSTPKGGGTAGGSLLKWLPIALLVAAPLLGALHTVAHAKGVQNNAVLVGSSAFPSAKGDARFRQDADGTTTLTVGLENGAPRAVFQATL